MSCARSLDYGLGTGTGLEGLGQTGSQRKEKEKGREGKGKGKKIHKMIPWEDRNTGHLVNCYLINNIFTIRQV